MTLAERLGLGPGENFRDIALELRQPEVAELDRHEVAMHAQHRRHPDGQVDVGAALLRAKLQERVNTRQGHTPRGICGGLRTLFSPHRAAESTACKWKFDVTHGV